jgi:phosphatidylglycerol:prolipoprotein diacylglycerol transferase
MINKIELGPFTLHFYGVIIMLGALIAAWLATREAKRRGLNGDLVWDMLPWLLIGGIIGARLWHVFTPTPTDIAVGRTTAWYFSNPLEILMMWNGGLGIPGAVIGGVVAMWVYVRKAHLTFATWVDIAAPGLALAQGIGRWGNFLNQEVYGAPTNLPWGIFIEPQFRVAPFYDVAYYHPLFFYEFLWNILTMFVLLWLGRKFAARLKQGDIFLVYLLMYPFGRFWLEFLRLNSSEMFGLNINQAIMGVIFVAALIALLVRHNPFKKDQNISEAAETDSTD